MHSIERDSTCRVSFAYLLPLAFLASVPDSKLVGQRTIQPSAVTTSAPSSFATVEPLVRPFFQI